jgi:hypothetical protein
MIIERLPGGGDASQESNYDVSSYLRLNQVKPSLDK